MSEKWTQTLAELLALQRKVLRKLNEALGITRELAEAVEREDQVSVRLLLSSRQMPLLELQELDAAMDLKRCELSGADEAAFDRLVTRRGAAEDPAEQELADQLARNRRVLEQLTQLDRRVSEKLCRERSIYRRDET
ncbi:hypothetical protein [uncultured Oscillibacter sp.]|uniref:hypothetical protein n=1 Tax=uncultured Oscillibacter sp. TaxID=876091 RepID=UPI0025ED02F1|nr:hypothetical protein [uncultured Oscillibacter sp.]